MWGLGAGFYLVAVFHRMALGVAGLTAQDHLHIGPGALASFAALQFAVYLAMQVPAGLAADRIGPRRTLAAGLACMAAGEVVFALATSLPAGLAGRALIGLGDALTLLNVLRLAQSWLPRRLGPLVSTLTGAVGAVGQLLGTIPLRAALDAWGWEATFAASSGLTVALLVLCLAVVRDRPRDVEAPHAGAHQPVLATLRACWASPGTRQGFWVHMGLFCPFQVVAALWGVPFLVQGHGLPAATAATYLSVLIGTFAVAGPLVGHVASRGEHVQDRLVVALNVVVLVPWVAIVAWPGGEAPRALLLAAFVACGLAAGGGMLAFDIGRRGTPALALGSATAIVNCGGFLAGIVCLEGVGLLLGADPTAERYGLALTPMLAFSLLGLVQGARLARRRGGVTNRRTGCAPTAEPVSMSAP